MKKNLFFSILLLATIGLVAQQKAVYKAAKMNPLLKNYSLKKAIHPQKEYTSVVELNPSIVNTPKDIQMDGIGNTIYDLQSNAAVDHRMFYFPDGTIGATWTLGNSPTSYTDRGTGYNYFDGNLWGNEPTARIETIRTGWPSYSSLGTNGEVVIAHKGTGLHMSKRDAKGTGSWIESDLPTPSGIAPTWPRVCTDGNNIHVLAADQQITYMGQEDPLVYYRSTDGGNTWDIQAQPISGVDGASYPKGFGGDQYSWAKPVNGTLAFVVGNLTSDLILMKSTDNGNTWTKKIIFQHPYPNWTDSVLTPDTPYSCDGTHAVALDNSGKAHVVFGRMRFLNDSIGDNSYSWFPGVDGLLYWNEDMPTITENEMKDLNTLDNNGNLIAWCLDLDNSGVILDNYTASGQIASYYTGLTSMPQISIDDNNDMFVTYKMTMENMQSSGSNQFFNHIWGRGFSGGQWAPLFAEITTGVDFDYAECVFPSMAQNTSSNQIFLWTQQDVEPGLAIRGDSDPTGTNYIVALTVDKSELLGVNKNPNSFTIGSSINVFPNPANDYINISVAAINGKIQNVKIVDVLGNEIKELNINSLSQNINISDLLKGIYMVVVNTTKATYSQKFIKE